MGKIMDKIIWVASAVFTASNMVLSFFIMIFLNPVLGAGAFGCGCLGVVAAYRGRTKEAAYLRCISLTLSILTLMVELAVIIFLAHMIYQDMREKWALTMDLMEEIPNTEPEFSIEM